MDTLSSAVALLEGLRKLRSEYLDLQKQCEQLVLC
jgi:hypothetical protein